MSSTVYTLPLNFIITLYGRYYYLLVINDKKKSEK